jgi:hypothetical protein
MAQQRMVIEVQPTPALEQMIRRILAEGEREQHRHRASCHGPAGELACGQDDRPAADEWEPAVIGNHPDTQRFLFVDEIGEEHRPLRSNVHAALAKGWRQAFVKKVGK